MISYSMGDGMPEVEITKIAEAKPATQSKTMWAGFLGTFLGGLDLIQEVLTSPEIGDVKSSVSLILVSLLSIYGRLKADKRISGLF